MNKKFEGFFLNRPFVIIFLLGLGMLLFSLSWDRIYPEKYLLGKTLLNVMGIAFVSVALTAPISNYFQFRTLSEHMAILRGAQNSGIVHIYESRIEESREFQEALEDEHTKADKISIACIAYPLFQQIYTSESIQEAMFNPKVEVRILLLDPMGDNAEERAEIETGRGTKIDIDRSLARFAVILKERAKKLNISFENGELLPSDSLKKVNMWVHLYDFAPIAFLIITDKSLFLEQYHFGKHRSFRPGDCIGQRTPVLQFDSNSETYAILASHFEYMWGKKSRDLTNDLLQSK